ncbi:MAG: S8 family peptidase [Cyanobacteria bacterium J06643_5]
MQANFNDSNLFSQTENNVAPITPVNGLNDDLIRNNSNFFNHSSFESSTTDNLIDNSVEQSLTPNLNNSDITVAENNIQLNSQVNYQENFQDNHFNTASINKNTDFYASEGYSSSNGYGLVDAVEAVAQVTGEDSFDEVPNTGGKDWGADAVNAPEVWEQGYTGEGVVVAVLDTGVDYNHDDLKNNIWTNQGEIVGNGIDDDGNGYIDDVYGWNFDGNNGNTMDISGHGTHVSGTIAGENNGFGVTGIAYDAQIMPVKVLDDTGSGSNTSVAEGIYYAVDNGADVINLSLGGSLPSSEVSEAVQYASNQGVTVVMAAGNSGGVTPLYPARYADQYGIAVGAIDEDENMASFSNRAGSQELTYVTAPGVDIYSTLPDNQYESYSGTSMATPHVAGVVALMLSANPNLDSKEIRQIIEETASNDSQETPLFPDFGDIFPDLNLGVSNSAESDLNSGYAARSFNIDLDLSNISVLNESANYYFSSHSISYQQDTRRFSRDIKSILEEDEILFELKN